MQIPPELVHLPNKELAATLGVSRQAILRARRRADNLCVRCGHIAAPGSQHCLNHQRAKRKDSRLRARKANGYKPWQPGRRGRPPLTAKT